ncbi:hypothetical protein CTAYLR_008600 [Chrysophaeum taylorii]|uniref:Uncharacterized protein n=1 Tax=Chrysophaeum taylorii TaxID=2483200 RepID=A0AAD7UJM1_9STRA|nr:hypothetical protein CTAYLR_008600 [Chrysophaeum taylorii]
MLVSSGWPQARAEPKRDCAVILAGHARTYDLTAKSVRENLIAANQEWWNFSVFALTYSLRDRKRGGDKSVHTRMGRNVSDVTAARVRDKYFNIPEDQIHARVVDEIFVKRMLPPSIRLKANSTYTQQHRLRVSMMFRMVAEAFEMVVEHERRANRSFALVVKLRFDLKILRPFVLDARHRGAIIVVPRRMDRGPSGLSPAQIRTRPCDVNGTEQPKWMQDHIAYGPSRVMALYCNGTDLYVRHSGTRGSTTPEHILATWMRRHRIQVLCDPTIRYTILR